MAAKKTEQNKFLLYKGKPLVRCGNTIYYGNMTDTHVIMMQILDSQNNQDLDIATKVSISLILTDESLKLKDRIVKRIEKPGLYPAMDIAAIWPSPL